MNNKKTLGGLLVKKISSTLLLLTLVSCSSHSVKYQKDVVIARIDNLNERPNWFSETIDTEEVGDTLIFWGRSTLKKGERLEVGFKIAELNAKSRIASFVSEKIQTISQAADEINSEDQTIFRGIITQRAKVKLSQTSGGKKYWEKVETSSPSGERELEYRVFNSIIIRKSDLTNLVKLSLQDGRGKLSKSFSEKVEREFESIANEDTDEIR
jgi:hypothetical protein